VSEILPDGNQHSDYGLMGGLVRLPVEGYDILIFSNIDVPKKKGENDYFFESRSAERKRGTVWVSFDGGKTWPLKRLVDEGSFAYSSLAAGREDSPSEGMIYLLYESGGGAKLARFNLAWLTKGHPWKSFL
jgi:sialidase-1